MSSYDVNNQNSRFPSAPPQQPFQQPQQDTMRTTPLLPASYQQTTMQQQVPLPPYQQQMNQAPQQQFNNIEYDVTDYGHLIFTLGGRKILSLTPEEAVMQINAPLCCANTTKRMPYGELGSVDISNVLCCWCFVAPGLHSKNPIQPGCGCQKGLVQQIVEDLKARQFGRGDTGIVQRAEENMRMMQILMQDVNDVKSQLGLIIQHMGLQQPVTQQRQMQQQPQITNQQQGMQQM